MMMRMRTRGAVDQGDSSLSLKYLIYQIFTPSLLLLYLRTIVNKSSMLNQHSGKECNFVFWALHVDQLEGRMTWPVLYRDKAAMSAHHHCGMPWCETQTDSPRVFFGHLSYTKSSKASLTIKRYTSLIISRLSLIRLHFWNLYCMYRKLFFDC